MASNYVSLSNNDSAADIGSSSTVSVTNFPNTQPVSGTVAVSNFPATQVISATALPLPTGAASEAELVAVQGSILDAKASNDTRLDSIIAKVTQGWSTVSVSAQVAVGATSTQLIASNTNRKYFHIVNNSTAAAFLQYGSAAQVNRGIKLNVGAMLTLSGYELYLGQINAISTSTTINLDILEGT